MGKIEEGKLIEQLALREQNKKQCLMNSEEGG